jgi:hypothetical protein
MKGCQVPRISPDRCGPDDDDVGVREATLGARLLQGAQAEDANPVAGALAFTKDRAPVMMLSEICLVYTESMIS